ncbi:MAG: hypothetical protein GOVbin703_62 [Prokaryotic dsDNA virus sp.]|nr:MAG: hypothetical protein GOVbin703_62 [Prokaryotic dsDNA virus sp.]|tara:strand:+ start:6798 stop:9155 length:2358 start_codon:yes stop_codon:yes gene_type:complete
MSKFIPSPDILNGTQKKRARKSFSDQKGSLFHELKKVVKESYGSDAFAGVGNMQAIVLAKVDAGDPSKQAWKNPLTAYSYHVKNKVPDFIEIRYRVPELHAHLPEPKDANDHKAINLHPLAIIKKDKGIPEVGDIVTLDFADKVNFTGAMVVETFNSEQPPNAGGGMCKPAGTFNSAPAPLNTAAPTGDSIEPAASSFGASNNPAQEGFENGIRYDNSEEYINSFDSITGDSNKRKIKRNIYIVSLDEFNSMPDFSDSNSIVEALSSKNVFSVCFTVADRGILLGDRIRLLSIIDKLTEHNYDVSLMVRERNKNFNKAMLHLSKIARTVKVKNIVFELVDNYTESEMLRIDGAFRNLSDSVGCNYCAVIKENYIDSFLPSLQDYTFIASNRYDYSLRNSKVTDSNAVHTAREALSSRYTDSMPLYYLGGINLLQTPNEPCVVGTRSPDILADEIEVFSTAPGNAHYMIDNYKFLTAELSTAIIRNTTGNGVIEESLKQSLLNSMFTDESPEIANVRDIQSVAGLEEIEQPTFNTEATGSQDATPAPSAPFASAPGAVCPAQAGGSQPAGGGAPGPAVQAPSFRFDSIDNYQNLGWTTNASNAINNVIFEFMEKLSAAIYRRIPATDPIFTNSSPKKIRLTSTARTYEKQAYLMWDKMRAQGDYGVTSIYNENTTWVKTVMRTYHEGGRPQSAEAIYANPKFAEAVEAIRVRVEVDGGGSPHLKGRGVDIHTWSHLQAEGVPNAQSATKAQMEASRYVRAIVEACAEAGGRPVVENYQQHVHISIL